jgi:predicted RNase H-like HicB family nuclease
MQILNYRIIVEKEKQGKDYVYVAHAPTLGISDFGKSIDEAVKNCEKAIKLYIETLRDTGNQIPEPDQDEYFVTSKKIQLFA